MQVKASQARALYIQFGFAAASTWDLAKLSQRMQKIEDAVEPGTTIADAGLQKLLNDCLAANKAGTAITVVDDAAAGATAATPPTNTGGDAPVATATGKKKAAAAGGAKKTAVKKAAPKAAPATKPAPVKKAAVKKAAPKKAPATATKPPKTAKADKVAKEKAVPGVRETMARPYVAGLVLKHFGLDKGVTDEMVKALDKTYPAKNPRESKFCLRNAWHALRAFTKGKPAEELKLS